MKLQRTGFTEGNLIFIEHLNKNQIFNKDLDELKILDINRMYSKAGFYDKAIKGNYFDIDHNKAYKSTVFQRWINDFSNSLNNSDYLEYMSHVRSNDKLKYLRKNLENYIEKLNNENNKKNIKYKNYWKKHESIYKCLGNKKILVVNSFASLIFKQYSSGNVHKIFNDFPRLADIDYIDFPYTFFNDGPHSNFFETLEYYFELIKLKHFDLALISCGPYGCILVDRIVKVLGRDAYTMGSGITTMFGIQPKKHETYWIGEIPREYIPDGFEKIEKGRYWIG
jgi:hypothetical protein